MAVKRAVRKVYSLWGERGDWDMPSLLRHFYRDRQHCSCCMCGNLRRHFGTPNIQHQKVIDAEQVDD